MTKMKFEIIDLGARGDGVSTDGRFIPYALPGEVVEIDDALLDKKPTIVHPSPHRVEPECEHFGVCGGCSLQHLEAREYLKWKRQQVIEAFSAQGLTPEVDLCEPVGNGQRRRAVFSAAFVNNDIKFGFLARQSHAIIDIRECPVLITTISSELQKLRAFAGQVAPRSEISKFAVLACDNGLDIAISAKTELSKRLRKTIVDWAVNNQIARVSYNDEVIVETSRPLVTVAEAILTPPPGSFSQAVTSCERQIAELVKAHLKKSSRIVDLFSGFGTFALNLIHKSTVHAVEFEHQSLDSLDLAARQLQGAKKLTVEQRDLVRRPLQTSELDKFNAAIFDPPRAGAEAQATELAKSTILKIAAISCNPVTLARDAKILVDGGYKITKVTPIDQFLYSPHVEVVALFEREKTRPKKRIFG